MSGNDTRAPSPGANARAPRRPRPGPLAVAFAVLAAVLAWQWLDGRSRLDALRDEVAQRLRATESESRDARLLAKQAQDALRDVQAKESQLEVKLAESQSQQV